MRLRSHAIPETPLNEDVMSMVASGAGVSGEEFQSRIEAQTLLRRLRTLAELSELAVFLASDPRERHDRQHCKPERWRDPPSPISCVAAP
jgi:hypothetical protein